MVGSFLMHAVMASLNGLPAAIKRVYIALIADNVAMYTTPRT